MSAAKSGAEPDKYPGLRFAYPGYGAYQGPAFLIGMAGTSPAMTV